MTTGRVVTTLAALSLLAALVLAVAPNPGTAVIGGPPHRVNCGNILVNHPYSGDDGCQDEHISRTGLIFLAWLVALPLGAVGLLLLRRELAEA